MNLQTNITFENDSQHCSHHKIYQLGCYYLEASWVLAASTTAARLPPPTLVGVPPTEGVGVAVGVAVGVGVAAQEGPGRVYSIDKTSRV